MANYIPKEFGLDNNVLAEGVEILYSIWTITRVSDGVVVHYDPKDEVNKLSKLFVDVFELGETYSIKMALVTTDGPTIETEPFIATITDNKAVIDLYPMPAVVDTPILSMPYDMDNIPNTSIMFETQPISVPGNAVHEYSDWWLVNDKNKIVWKSLKDRDNLTDIKVTGITLDSNSVYTMYCVHKANNRDSSGAGGITFKPVLLSELDIVGDLSDAFFMNKIETRLANDIPDMINLTYELYGEDFELLYTNNNNTGLITIPKLDEDEETFIIDPDDGYKYYTLRLRVITNETTLGWKDYIFKPKEWLVDSAKYNDREFLYKGKLSTKKITIDGFSYPTIETEPTKGMGYGISQLPDGLFLIMYKVKEWGLFEYIDKESRFKLLKPVDFSFMYTGVSMNGVNSIPYFNAVILPNAKILLTPADSSILNVSSYIVDYNTVTKTVDIDSAKTVSIPYVSDSARYVANDKLVYFTNSDVGYLDLDTGTYVSLGNNPINNSNSFVVIPLNEVRYRFISFSRTNNTTVDNRYFDVEFIDDFTDVLISTVNTFTRATNTDTDKRSTPVVLRNNNIVCLPLVKNVATDNITKYDSDLISLGKESLTIDCYNTYYGFTVYFNNGKRMWLSSGKGNSDAVIYE
jgi:hypothetical protein